jgi:4-amino-4-deoxy-L-arabinose transferase-like glycosyltransferase
MSATTHDGVRVSPRRRVRAFSLPRPELAALLVLAGVLNLWALSTNGWANEYYAGAVRSMAASWHAFVFGSLDVNGVMTVDKPPLALWVQALSVRAFGWSSWSVLVPQALMGVASVGLVYDLTRRRFGRAGGFVAGAVLALTPMTVAVSRHNNPDALLVLCVVGALWAVVRGLEDGRVRWMVLAGVCVGLGFETKMGAALLVVPALAVAWLWAAPRGRVRGLLAGGLAMVVAGGAWPLLVALTPASSRPWISGTSDNSIWSLITDYNGLGRLDGQAGGPAAAAVGGGGGPGSAGGGVFGGSAGPLRLLNDALGGQAGWLLGFALIAGLALVVSSRLSRRDPVTGWILAVGGSALTAAVAFSSAKGIFHPYYVSELAPFTAALIGAGFVRFARGDLLARVAGPLAIAAGVITELIVLSGTEGSLDWLPPVLVLVGVSAAGALAFGPNARARNAGIATAAATLLIAPAAWSVETLGHATSGTFPAGGPANAGGGFGGPGGGGRDGFGGGRGGPPAGGSFGAPGGAPPGAPGGTTPGGSSGTTPGGGTAPRGGVGGPGGMFGGDSASLTSALAYVEANGGGTLAVSSQSTAAAAIIASDADVVGLGGFSGRESEVSVSWLADQVRAGKIRWVLPDGSGGGGLRNDGRTGSTTAMAAVAAACKQVDTHGVTLYDCQGRADTLATP